MRLPGAYYCRVSTEGQTVENQILEIVAAGFHVEAHRIICDVVSGSVAAKQRRGFIKLQERLEQGDVLIVTKLDRLGRNSLDVRATVECLARSGVRVHCLALGGADLTSPAGRMTMMVISVVAEFERDLLIERTSAGILRAKAAGKKFGRPRALTPAQESEVIACLQSAMPIAAIARQVVTSRQTIMRIRDRLQDVGRSRNELGVP